MRRPVSSIAVVCQRLGVELGPQVSAEAEGGPVAEPRSRQSEHAPRRYGNLLRRNTGGAAVHPASLLSLWPGGLEAWTSHVFNGLSSASRPQTPGGWAPVSRRAALFKARWWTRRRRRSLSNSSATTSA